MTIRLSDDWNGADFLALHSDGITLKIQLKPRLTFGKKYMGKELWICFPSGSDWYLYPHDQLFAVVSADSKIEASESWRSAGLYSMGSLSKKLTGYLEKHRIT